MKKKLWIPTMITIGAAVAYTLLNKQKKKPSKSISQAPIEQEDFKDGEKIKEAKPTKLKIQSPQMINRTFSIALSRVDEYEQPLYPLPLQVTLNQTFDNVYYAICLEDIDTQNNLGFSWINWLVCNLSKLPYDESDASVIHGQNSWYEDGFGGLIRYDSLHQYTLHVYVLDCMLDIYPGFTKEEFLEKAQGHIKEHVFLDATF